MKLPKIEETVYFTNRQFKDENGNILGRVILYRLKGKEVFNYYMKCPYCSYEGEGEVELKRRPYRIKCPSCGKTITIEKLKPKKK